jgi:DNA-binding MarR family transcriptional regulator
MNYQDGKDQVGKEIPANVWEKWGVAAFRGYQAVPHDLLRYQAKLGLSNGELVTLLNILDFWWEAKNNPFPAVDQLAKRMSTDRRTVHRHLKSLQDKRYVVRDKGTETDEKRRFRLDGLVERLQQVVREECRLPATSDGQEFRRVA